MYPHADIPVFQMSVNTVNTPQESYEAGQRLSVLRDEGVLILGSGNIVHNLSLVDWDMQGGFDWADAFDYYIKSVVVIGRYEDAVHYQKAGQSVRQAFYYRDHYEPLLYVLGAARSDDTVSVYNDARVMGAISMTSYIIG